MLVVLLMSSLFGQAPPPSGGGLEAWNIKCPRGHAIEIQGRREGDNFHAVLNSLTLQCPRGDQLRLSAYSFRDGSQFHVLFPVAPAPQSVAAPKGATPAKNYGVSFEYLPKVRPGQSWYGGNVDYHPSVGAKGEPPNRVHVTFIGSQVEREAARKDLERSPGFQRIAESMGDNLAVQDYGPESPLVSEIGLVDGGKPDVVIQQTKGGRVMFRAHNYPGADVVVSEIRKADPAYRPSDDPDGKALDMGIDMNVLMAEYGITPEIIVGIAMTGVLLIAVHKGVL